MVRAFDDRQVLREAIERSCRRATGDTGTTENTGPARHTGTTESPGQG